MLPHDEAQVKKYSNLGFTLAKLFFIITKRFAIAKEKARCSEEQNENKMKPRVRRREATLGRNDDVRPSKSTLRRSE